MRYKYTPLVLVLLLSLFVSCSRGRQLPFSFVQVCDPQLGMGGYAHDVASLRQTVTQINELDCDFVVICGDLVHHSGDSAYADFLNIIAEFEIPCYLAAGNHDVGNIPNDTTLTYYRNTIGKDYYAFEHGGYVFVVTNTQLWKTNVGEESQKHDRWFKEVLTHRKSAQLPHIVIGHHPLFVESADEEEAYYNLPPVKRQELLDLFKASRVVAYLSGHKHETLLNNYIGMQLVSGESTSRNFDKRPLGFRLWEVDKDTVLHHYVPLNPF